MAFNLVIENFAERDDINEAFGLSREIRVIRAEPEFHLIEEVETGPVDECTARWAVFGREENGGCEDALEGVNNPPIVVSIWTKAEKTQHL